MTTYLSLRNVQNLAVTSLTASAAITGSTVSAASAFNTQAIVGSTIAMNSTVVALGQSTNQTYTNLSNGTYSNWITAKSSLSQAKKLAVSSTGQYQLVALDAALWLSTDTGVTWTQMTPANGLGIGLPATLANVTSAAISASGQYITVAVLGDILYASSDYGATFNNPAPSATPYAWLRLENSFTDTQGNSTVTPTGPPTFSSTVTPQTSSGYSMRLTNTAGGTATQYVRGTWAGSANFTVSFWMNPQSLNAIQVVFSSGSGGFIVFINSNNTINGQFPSGSGGNQLTITTSFTVAVNTWYFVTLIYQTNGLCSFYVNNTLIGTANNAGGLGSFSSSGLFGLGTYDTIQTLAYNGYLDDFRLYNSAIAYQPVALAPAVWMKMEGSTADAMGLITPTVTGTVTYVPGVVGSQAVLLANTPSSNTGVNYIQGTAPVGSDVTVSFWFNVQSFGSDYQAIFTMYSGGFYVFTDDVGKVVYLRFPTGSGGNIQQYSYSITANTWYHVAMIFKINGTCSAYINHTLIGSPFSNSGGWGTFTSTGIFRLGSNDSTVNKAFNGYIDDFRLYNSAAVPPTGTVLTTNQNWSQVALSGSGQYQLAGTAFGQVYQSNDYGRTWSVSTGAYGASSAGYVNALALSHSGQNMIVSSQKRTAAPNQTGLARATWVQDGVTWTASASSTQSGIYPAYAAFNTAITTPHPYAWNSANAYNTTTGAVTVAGATSTTVQGGIGVVLGEYLQLQSSVPIAIQSYTFASGDGTVGQMPKIYYIVGSTDGSTWYPIQYTTFGATNPYTAISQMATSYLVINYNGTQSLTAGQTGTCTTTTYTTTSAAYTYYRLIINAIWPSPTYASTCFSEFVPVFTLGAPIPTTAVANCYTPQQTGLTTATWQKEGVVYTASASGTHTGYGAAYTAFNNAIGTAANSWVGGQGATNGYDGTTGTWSSNYTSQTTIQTVGAVNGDWLQIQTSVPLVLSSYAFAADSYSVNELPKNYYIVGSNDGTTWYPIQSVTSTTITGTVGSAMNGFIITNYTGAQSFAGNLVVTYTTTSYSYTTLAYTYFRIVIQTVFPVQGSNVGIGEWYLNFLGGQSYSTNAGSTWSIIPNMNYNAPQSMSASGQYQLAVANQPMLARLTMDNTAADSLGGLTATTGAGTVTYSSSVYKVGTHAAFFNNTASNVPSVYLNYTLPAALYKPSVLTMAGWIYLTTYPSGSAVPLMLTDTAGYSNGFFINSNSSIQFNCSTTASPTYGGFSLSPTISLNTWYHLAMTFLNGTFTFYINGVSVGTVTLGGLLCGWNSTNMTNLLVGAGMTNTYAYAGYVDDVRLYPAALTAAQIAALYADPASSQFLSISSGSPTGLASNPTTTTTLLGTNATTIVDTAQSFNGQIMVVITAATTGTNVYYSTNAGTSWTGIAVGLATAPLVSCAVSADGSYVTVASATTVYTLNNNGKGFTLAVGAQAGQVNQATNAIAIGYKAGQTNQSANSIVLNATGAALNSASQGFYVAPVAQSTSSASGTLQLLGYGADSQVVQTGIQAYSTGVLSFSPNTITRLYSGPTQQYQPNWDYYSSYIGNARWDGNTWNLATDGINYGYSMINYGWRQIQFYTGLNINTSTITDAQMQPSQRMIITGSGNVGIGETNPIQGRLQVAGRSVFGYIAATRTGIVLDNETLVTGSTFPCIQGVATNMAATSVVINGNGGNVGIGTTNPGTALQINGAVSSRYFTVTASSATTTILLNSTSGTNPYFGTNCVLLITATAISGYTTAGGSTFSTATYVAYGLSAPSYANLFGSASVYPSNVYMSQNGYGVDLNTTTSAFYGTYQISILRLS